jgi:hypothetical protein
MVIQKHIILIILFVAVTVSVSCIKPQETKTPPGNTTAGPASSEPADSNQVSAVGSQDDTLLPGAILNGSLEGTALNLIEKLGYDTNIITTSRNETLPNYELEVTINDGFGPLAYIHSRPDYSGLVFLKFRIVTSEMSPAIVQPGPDLPDRIASALGLIENGYKKAEFITNPGKVEYRKYITLNGSEVCNHRVLILLAPSMGDPRMNANHNQAPTTNGPLGLKTLMFFDFKNVPEDSTLIARDAALQAVLTSLNNTTLVPQHSELIMIALKPEEPSTGTLCWEFTFEGQKPEYIDAIYSTMVTSQVFF